MAAQAIKDLDDLLRGPSRPVIYTPPEMTPQWQPDYAQRVEQAVAKALDAGAAAEKVFALLDAAASLDLDSIPDQLLSSCLAAGLSGDTDMGGETLLHYLINTQYPIPLGSLSSTNGSNSSIPASGHGQVALQLDQHAAEALQRLEGLLPMLPVRHHPACGSVTLAELLRRGATPNLTDSSGNTVLHMVVACMVNKKHFPDPTAADQRHAQQLSEEAEQQAGGDGDAAGTAAAPTQMNDNDAARAAYATAAFMALLQAGWDPTVRNNNGYTLSDLILEGLSRYQTELSDLQDPDGMAQTTVALLSQKAPDKGLQQFLDAKIQGVQAVVDALLLMRRLAASVEVPRKRQSALSLVLLWLLLLAVCMWWVYGRR